MTVTYSAEFKDKEVKEFLDQISKNLKAANENKLNKIARLFSVVVFKDIINHFKEAKGPTEPWAKWSDLYTDLQTRRGKRWPGNALRFSGFLIQSFKPTNYRLTNEGLLWFNNAKTKGGFEYAYHHDEGAIKTRPYMWLSKDAFEEIAQIALNSLVDDDWR